VKKEHMYLALAFVAGTFLGPMIKEKLWPASPARPADMPRA